MVSKSSVDAYPYICKRGNLVNNQPRFIALDHRGVFALFSFFTAIFSLLVVVVTILPPPFTPAQQLSSFMNNKAIYYIMALIVLLWSALSIPFVAGLGTLLREKSSGLALTATILSCAGIMLLGFARYSYVGALIAIDAMSNGASNAAEATYQASIWANLQFYLSDPPLFAWGLGQVLFGWLAWRSQVLPNWLAIVGIFGGIACSIASLDAPKDAVLLALLSISSFSVWGFTMGAMLLRNR
jgi:hypothetical protein